MLQPGSAGSNLYGWRVSRHQQTACCVFGVPDGLYAVGPNGFPDFSTMRSLEELGVEDWAAQVWRHLLPRERSVLIDTSAATWTMIGLSRLRKKGREAWERGARWKRGPSGRVFAAIPGAAPDVAGHVLDWLGYDDEERPELVIVPYAEKESLDQDRVFQWCQGSWAEPAILVPMMAERIFAFYNGWLHVAVPCQISTEISDQLARLASEWKLSIAEGPGSWAWPTSRWRWS